MLTIDPLRGAVKRFIYAAFIPFRLLRLGLGTRCPGHRMPSQAGGRLARPSRMAGVLPPLPLTWTQLFTSRRTVRRFRAGRGVAGAHWMRGAQSAAPGC